MEIALITNIHTGCEVCIQYLSKKLDMDKCIIETGQHLRIVYEDQSYFTHELVVNIERLNESIIKIETTKKIWMLQKLNLEEEI